MVNKLKTTKMNETLANKEKSSQIASRNFLRTCFFDELGSFLRFSWLLLKNERIMKKKACLIVRPGDLKVPNMVNRRISLVNSADNYVNEIDLIKTYI